MQHTDGAEVASHHDRRQRCPGPTRVLAGEPRAHCPKSVLEKQNRARYYRLAKSSLGYLPALPISERFVF